MEFEIIIPAYNEAKNLKLLIERASLAAQENQYTAEQFNLLLVNNGSFDDSKLILSELKQSDLGAWFRIVTVEVNQGYGYGLWQGLQASTAEYVGWSHADLQCDPNDAFRALQMIKSCPDKRLIVKGVRIGRDWKDKIISRVFEALAWLILGVRVFEMNAQPKVFHRDFLKEIINPPKTFAFDLYALYCGQKAGYKTRAIQVQFPPRIHGVSNWASGFISRYKTIWGIIKYMFELRKKEGSM